LPRGDEEENNSHIQFCCVAICKSVEMVDYEGAARLFGSEACKKGFHKNSGQRKQSALGGAVEF
jgi:hypothetical protein